VAAVATPLLRRIVSLLRTTEKAAEKAKAGEKVEGGLAKEAEKGIRSLEKRIAEHEKKLADFKENPTVRPGMEGQPKGKVEAQQQARIEHLEKEIKTFKDNIEKLKDSK
jgi:uncharacterized protein YceH (UPF0502 family)